MPRMGQERTYPLKALARKSPFIDDWTHRLARLRNLQDALFDSETFSIRLIRVRDERPPVTTIENETDLAERLLKTSDDEFRILSLFQAYSLDPLQCTENAIMKVIEEWAVSAMFLDVLLKFGDQPKVFEESSGFRQATQNPEGSFEICYQLMYIEPSGRACPRDPWSFRQTGVQHKYNNKTNQSTIILLHPNRESVVQGKLEALAESTDRQALAAHPLNVHLVIIDSYMAHWQDHMESLAESLHEIRKHILVIDTKISMFEAKELQRLRNIEDKILCRALRCLKSTRVLVHSLNSINDGLPTNDTAFVVETTSIRQQLQLINHRIDGHINASEILAERVQATLGLLTNMLDLQNQASSDRISTRMLRLTRESVDDNATVRVITVCTLIYLPASFMATFFGMNFFEFGSDIRALRASPNFWIYVAATIPLTMITVGAWYVFKLQHDRKRRKRHDEEEAV